MATHAVAISKHATLTPNTVDTVTLTSTASRVLMLNRTPAPSVDVAIYATINGADPTVGGNDTIVVASGETYETPPNTALPANTDVVVKLISATACAYTVMGEG